MPGDTVTLRFPACHFAYYRPWQMPAARYGGSGYPDGRARDTIQMCVCAMVACGSAHDLPELFDGEPRKCPLLHFLWSADATNMLCLRRCQPAKRALLQSVRFAAGWRAISCGRPP